MSLSPMRLAIAGAISLASSLNMQAITALAATGSCGSVGECLKEIAANQSEQDKLSKEIPEVDVRLATRDQQIRGESKILATDKSHYTVECAEIMNQKIALEEAFDRRQSELDRRNSALNQLILAFTRRCTGVQLPPQEAAQRTAECDATRKDLVSRTKALDSDKARLKADRKPLAACQQRDRDLVRRDQSLTEKREALSAATLAQTARKNNLSALMSRANDLSRRIVELKFADKEWKAQAAAKCKDMRDLEGQQCCMQVFWDGRDPGECRFGLVVVFLRDAGLFRSGETKPSVTPAPPACTPRMRRAGRC